MDRVDPLGSWFSLGDRKIDELPSVEESRALMPRSAESHAMSPVGVQTLHRRMPSSIFMPSAIGNVGSPVYAFQTAIGLTGTPSQYYLRLLTAQPNSLYFHATIDTLEQGVILSGLSIRAFRIDGTQTAVAELLRLDLDGFPTVLASVASTSNASNKTDSSNGMTAPGSSNNIVDLSNFTYVVRLRLGTAFNPDDVKVFWTDLQYTVPG